MKITKEQYQKWSAQAHNGFKLDLNFYLTWSEKQLIKDIKTENGDIIRTTIAYFPEYVTKTNEWGCKWNVRTGRHIPQKTVDRLVPLKSGCYRVIPINKSEPIGEPQNTKKYSVLCELTKEL